MRVRARCVSISCDNRAVGRFAAEYLMSQQFENFAYVSEFAGSCWSVERGRAFERRLRDSGYGVAVFPHLASAALITSEKDWRSSFANCPSHAPFLPAMISGRLT